MTYTIILNRGTVVKDDTGQVVSPCQSIDDPEFIAYQAWVNAGNQPTETYAPEDPATEPVPDSVSPLQARKALLQNNLLDQIDTYVKTLTREEQLAWEYCIEVRRDDPMINNAGAAFGLTTQQLDDLFRLAATL